MGHLLLPEVGVLPHRHRGDDPTQDAQDHEHAGDDSDLRSLGGQTEREQRQHPEAADDRCDSRDQQVPDAAPYITR